MKPRFVGRVCERSTDERKTQFGLFIGLSINQSWKGMVFWYCNLNFEFMLHEVTQTQGHHWAIHRWKIRGYKALQGIEMWSYWIMNIQDQLRVVRDCRNIVLMAVQLAIVNSKSYIFYNWKKCLETDLGSISGFLIHKICGESQGLCVVRGTHSSLLVFFFLICAQCSVLRLLKFFLAQDGSMGN